MYYYKFEGDTLTHTLIADAKPNGYVDFGEMIDWTKKHMVDGELQDVPLPPAPEPYAPTDAELLAQAKQSKLWQIESKLIELDRYLPRALEDFFAAENYNGKKLPQVQQDRLLEKVALRGKREAVDAAGTIEEVEGAEV